VRINVKDKNGQSIFGVVVNPERPPTVVRSPLDDAAPMTLDWDRAMDDSHHLRRCPVCGCEDLYVRKELPHLTLFVVLLFAAVVAMLMFGLVGLEWAVLTLVLLLGVDLGIFFFSKRILVCYQCLTEFRDVPIRRRHPGFDRAVAQRHRRG